MNDINLIHKDIITRKKALFVKKKGIKPTGRWTQRPKQTSYVVLISIQYNITLLSNTKLQNIIALQIVKPKFQWAIYQITILLQAIKWNVNFMYLLRF